MFLSPRTETGETSAFWKVYLW